MKKTINQGLSLLKQKKYDEAEIVFQTVAQDASTREAALNALVKIAIERKKIDLVLERLDQLLIEFPDQLEALIIRAHWRAIRGSINEYRITITSIMERLNKTPLTSIKLARKLLRGILYAYSGKDRFHYLSKLIEYTNQTIEKNSVTTDRFQLFQAELYFALRDYETMARIVEKFSTLDSPSPVLDSLHKVIKKYKSPNYPDYLAPKIFGIGLSRTGTSSLNKALKILGYHSIHWFNPHTNTLIEDQDYLLFDGFTDISVSYHFEKLYKTFPNARFIYTSRNMESWLRSIRVHYKDRRGIRVPSELTMYDSTQRFQGLGGLVEMNLYAQHATWEAAFQHFQKRVFHFFKDKPSDRFLDLGICEGEGWDKLCTFLERPVPTIPFPNNNRGPQY